MVACSGISGERPTSNNMTGHYSEYATVQYVFRMAQRAGIPGFGSRGEKQMTFERLLLIIHQAIRKATNRANYLFRQEIVKNLFTTEDLAATTNTAPEDPVTSPAAVVGLLSGLELHRHFIRRATTEDLVAGADELVRHVEHAATIDGPTSEPVVSTDATVAPAAEVGPSSSAKAFVGNAIWGLRVSRIAKLDVVPGASYSNLHDGLGIFSPPLRTRHGNG